MIIKTKPFKEACTTVLNAIDNSELSNYSEALELIGKGSLLFLNITNKEYYVSVKFELEEELKDEFKAVINAYTFLKLIAAVTTEDIELKLKENYLAVKANGNYKFPLIYENGDLMKLPKIEIVNETLIMNVGGDLLSSVVNYNSKILNKKETTPVQKLYYLDQEGCVTFTSCVCVNNFKLEKPIKLLLSNKVVRLFKLFKNDLLKFHLGYDKLNEYLTQTKIKLETSNITLTTILPSDTLLSQYPIEQLRKLANTIYPFTTVLKVEEFLEALNRLKVLDKNNEDCDFNCEENKLILKVGENEETLYIVNDDKVPTKELNYKMTLKLDHIKSVLETCEDQYITFNFGNKTSATFVRGNIVNVLTEVIKEDLENGLE